MNLIENVKWLLDNDYLIVVDSTPVLTAKFYKELKYTMPKDQAPLEVPEILETPVPVKSVPKKEVWNKFIEDAEIPWRVTAKDGGTYTVRQYNIPAANKLIKIIQDPNVDYDKLVASTKNYYKTVSYKLLLSKYLLNEVWSSEYKEWEKRGNKVRSSPGENSFED